MEQSITLPKKAFSVPLIFYVRLIECKEPLEVSFFIFQSSKGKFNTDLFSNTLQIIKCVA